MDLLGLPVRWPIVGAPMAGGPSTPALVVAVSGAGGLGMLAGGYLEAATLEQHIAEVRRSGVAAFGVNLFVPSRRAVDEAALHAYLASVHPEAEASGVDLVPSWDDDHWPHKAELLTRRPGPRRELHLRSPPPDLVAALHRVGSCVVVTVTTPAEAVVAAASGPTPCARRASRPAATRAPSTTTSPPTRVGASWRS